MARLDHVRHEMITTLVVYGGARSGKSSFLRCLHDRATPERRGTETPIGTGSSMPSLLDWVPLELGMIGGWTTRVHLYGLSHQREVDATRRVLLDGADGVILLADSQAERMQQNLAARASLNEQLGGRVSAMPLVLAYTKQDLPAELLLAPDALDRALNPDAVPSLVCNALRGTGVLETLHAAMTRVLRQIGPGRVA